MELDDRKLEILKAVIKNYLETGGSLSAPEQYLSFLS